MASPNNVIAYTTIANAKQLLDSAEKSFSHDSQPWDRDLAMLYKSAKQSLNALRVYLAQKADL